MSPRAAWRLDALGFREVYDYPGGKQDWFAAGRPAEGERPDDDRLAAHAEAVLTCALEQRVAYVLARIQASDWGFAVAVSDGNVVLGRLRGSDAEAAVGTTAGAAVRDVMREGPSTFRPNVSVGEMSEYMRRHDLSTAIVTTSQGILIGAVRRTALEAAIG
jgi:predicted transcriptional regulator